jgi:uncharacterized membrane protein YraQ (UPF0718 family)
MIIAHSLPLALIVLALGPALGGRLSRWAPSMRLLDGFVVSAVCGLVVIDVAPTMFATGSLLLPLLAAVGFALPSLFERLFVASRGKAHRTVIGIALLGLALHSMLDGVALTEGAQVDGSLLGLGVILHQFPVGLMVWAVFRDRPVTTAWLVVGAMGAMTVAGTVTSAGLIGVLGRGGAAALDAFIGGSLLHVVVHRTSNLGTGRPAISPFWESTGAIIGLTFLAIVIGASHGLAALTPSPVTAAYLQRFIALSADSAPALLLAYAVSGLIANSAPSSAIAWLRRGGALQQASRGMLLGLPLPICSCGVVPLYQSLVRRGAPPTAALALLVAAPELGADALLITLPLLGTRFAVIRLVAAALVALLVALAIGRLLPSRVPTQPSVGEAPAQSLWRKLRRAVHAGFGEMLDHTAPWILVGLLIAAAITPGVLTTLSITQLPPLVDVLVFALLGIPTFVCASAATPLVAVLIAGGVSPGAGLAFLLSGPATNLSTIGVLSRLHGKTIGLSFAVAVGLGAVCAGIVTNMLLGSWQPRAVGGPMDEPISALQRVALVSLGALTLWSLLRRGPRAFFGELALAVTSERHSHDHGGHAHAGDVHGAPPQPPTAPLSAPPVHVTPASASPASSH